MPDISMCTNETCPARIRCYRFLARPSTMQSYSDFKPKDGDTYCEFFWAVCGAKECCDMAHHKTYEAAYKQCLQDVLAGKVYDHETETYLQAKIVKPKGKKKNKGAKK